MQIQGSNWTLTFSAPVPAASTQAGSNGSIDPSTPTGMNLEKGKNITTSGEGLAPNSLVSVYLFSTPVLLGTVMTDSKGNFSVNFPTPANMELGEHTLQINGTSAANQTMSASIRIMAVKAAPIAKSFKFTVTFKVNSAVVDAKNLNIIRSAIKKVPAKVKSATAVVGLVTIKTTTQVKWLAKLRAAAVIKAMKKTGFKSIYKIVSVPNPTNNSLIDRKTNVTITWQVTTKG